MKQIAYEDIVSSVARLCEEANLCLGEGVLRALEEAREAESSPLGREVLGQILENAAIARDEGMPLCQDCGLAVVFLELGQEVHIVGGELHEAINEGVRRGYQCAHLRKSVVERPFSARVNTQDNTPAIMHTEVVPGDSLKISLLSKGGGAENMSRLRILTPAEGREGVISFVMETVEEAGANACPPLIVGVGIGGNFEKAAYLAKKALLREVGQPSPDAEVAALEREMLSQLNGLRIGPMGLGGKTTALAVHIETYPTHIASLPVAVNLQCHSSRHKTIVL